MNKSLKTNFIFNLISQLFTLILPLLTTPYLARILGEEGNGQYSFANSIITYFILFSNLGFTIYGQREISKCRDDKYKSSKMFFEIIYTRFIFVIISVVVLYFIVLFNGIGDKYKLLVLILSIQVIASFFDVTFYFQGIEDFKTIAMRSIILKILGLIFIFVFVKEQSDLWLYALGLSLTTILSNLIMWSKLFGKIQYVKFRELQILKNVKPSLVIFLPTLAVSIYSVLDKTMIGLLSSNPDYQNGCYEQAYKLNSAALILVTVISPIMLPRNTFNYSRNDIEGLRKNIYNASNYIWLISLPLLAGFLCLSSNLSSWFLGEGYDIVPLLMNIMAVRFIVSGFGVLFGEQLFLAIGKEKYNFYATMVAAILNLSLNLFLIPKYGALGAAYSTAISECTVTVILIIFVKKMNIISLKKIILQPIKYIVASIIMYFAVFYLNKYLDYSFWTFLLEVIVGAAIYGIILILLRDKFVIYILNNMKMILNKKKEGNKNNV